MKFSPVGMLVVAIGAVVAIIIWIVGYFGLPNEDTHRNLASNPPIESSVTNQTANGAANNAAGAAPAGPWYTLDKAPKTLDLAIASLAGDDPMNFEGYGKGDMKITVPAGWKVNVTYTNQQSGGITHSVGFVNWAQRQAKDGQFTPAFTGSVGPTNNFSNGVPAGQPVKYSFTADKAGQYAIVCGVPTHASMGMWDEFDVSASAQAPTIAAGGKTITVGK
jgi:sulfocyanin